MNQIRRDDLAQAVRDACGDISQRDSVTAVSAVFDTIKLAVNRGDTVSIREFGLFSMVSRKASMGRNPRTGDPIAIPARRVAKFKASKHFMGDDEAE
jgi:DNA-binding protein HU-beta